MSDTLDIQTIAWRPDERSGYYRTVVIRAGRHRTERVVPPAGEEHAFDRGLWDHRIEVSVSPTGRSVQVFVDGERVL